MLTAIIGGRPGMITSASGLSALLLYRLVNTDTIGATSFMFVPLVVGFAGMLQTVSSFFGFGKLATHFPAPMVVGMVNGLAILAIALQFRYAKVFPLTEADMSVGTAAAGDGKAVEADVTIALLSYFGEGLDWIQPWASFSVYFIEVFLAFAITTFVPRLTTFFPATLMAMLVVVVAEYGFARQFGAKTPLIGDYGGVEVRYILRFSWMLLAYLCMHHSPHGSSLIWAGEISLDHSIGLRVHPAIACVMGNLEDCHRIWVRSFCHPIRRDCGCAQRCQSVG